MAAIGMWLVFVLVFATLVGAQTGAPGPGAEAGAGEDLGGSTAEVSGKIKSIDPAGRTVLLEDGTRLMIPGSVNVDSGRAEGRRDREGERREQGRSEGRDRDPGQLREVEDDGASVSL